MLLLYLLKCFLTVIWIIFAVIQNEKKSNKSPSTQSILNKLSKLKSEKKQKHPSEIFETTNLSASDISNGSLDLSTENEEQNINNSNKCSLESELKNHDLPTAGTELHNQSAEIEGKNKRGINYIYVEPCT